MSLIPQSVKVINFYTATRALLGHFHEIRTHLDGRPTSRESDSDEWYSEWNPRYEEWKISEDVEKRVEELVTQANTLYQRITELFDGDLRELSASANVSGAVRVGELNGQSYAYLALLVLQLEMELIPMSGLMPIMLKFIVQKAAHSPFKRYPTSRYVESETELYRNLLDGLAREEEWIRRLLDSGAATAVMVQSESTPTITSNSESPLQLHSSKVNDETNFPKKEKKKRKDIDEQIKLAMSFIWSYYQKNDCVPKNRDIYEHLEISKSNYYAKLLKNSRIREVLERVGTSGTNELPKGRVNDGVLDVMDSSIDPSVEIDKRLDAIAPSTEIDGK